MVDPASTVNERKGAWAVLVVGDRRYLGYALIHQDALEEEYPNETDAASLRDTVQVVITLRRGGGWIGLCPAFELHLEEGDDRTRPQRKATLTMVDFVRYPEKLAVMLRPDTIYFLDELDPEDKGRYEALLETALKQMRARRRK